MTDLDRAIADSRALHHDPEVTYSAYWFNEYRSRMGNLLAALDAARSQAVAWGMQSANGDIIDCINPEEHAKYEGEYTVPMFAAPPAAAVSADACPACGKNWGEHRLGYSASACKQRPSATQAPHAAAVPRTYTEDEAWREGHGVDWAQGWNACRAAMLAAAAQGVGRE